MLTALVIVGCLAYFAIAGYFWRRFAWELNRDWINTRNESLALGLMKGIVWPLALAWRSAVATDTFMLPPPALRQKEREEAMQRRIAELERELGIGTPHD